MSGADSRTVMRMSPSVVCAKTSRRYESVSVR